MNGMSTLEIVAGLLRNHSPELRDGRTPVGLDSPLESLGIDSLELLSLAADIERAFDVDIDDAAVGSAKTVAHLVSIVDTARQQVC